MRRPESEVTLAAGVAIGLLLAILLFALFVVGAAYFDPTAFGLAPCRDRPVALAYFGASALAALAGFATAGIAFVRRRPGRAITALLPALVLGIAWAAIAPRPLVAALAPGDRPSYCTRE